MGVALAVLLFRTDVWGRRPLLFLLGLAAFVPLPLHATAWLGAFGNAGRMQAIGVRPILVGRFGVAVISALAALPWVVLLSGVGLRLVEPELEEGALLDWPAWRVWSGVTLRRSLGAVAAAALSVAVLAAGDMTVTDLLQVRTYAEEAYIQFTLGNGPASASAVAIPPLLVLGAVVMLVGRSLSRHAPRRLASAFERSKTWRLGRWRVPLGAFLVALVGNIVALPLYSLICARDGSAAGRRSASRRRGRLPASGGSLRLAFEESVEPLTTSVTLALGAATLTLVLAWAICWLSRASRGWQLVCAGRRGADARRAGAGRRHGVASRLSNRRLDLRHAVDRRPRDVGSGLAVHGPGPLAVSSRLAVRGLRGGGGGRRGAGRPGLSDRDPPLPACEPGRLGRGVRPRPRRTAGDQPDHPAGGARRSAS